MKTCCQLTAPRKGRVYAQRRKYAKLLIKDMKALGKMRIARFACVDVVRTGLIKVVHCYAQRRLVLFALQMVIMVQLSLIALTAPRVVTRMGSHATKDLGAPAVTEELTAQPVQKYFTNKSAAQAPECFV